MQKLTPEQITFIDTYLQKSDVIFVDVRAELTDHIASAVEEKMEIENVDFYEAFKGFMIANKKQLLKSKDCTIPSIINFGESLCKPYNLIIAILIIVGCYIILQFPEPIEIFKNVHLVLFGSTIFIALVQFIYTFLILQKRFAYLEKLSIVLTGIYYFNMAFNGFFNNFFGGMTSVAIASYLTLTYIIYWFQTLKKFKKKYAFL